MGKMERTFIRINNFNKQPKEIIQGCLLQHHNNKRMGHLHDVCQDRDFYFSGWNSLCFDKGNRCGEIAGNRCLQGLHE